MVSCKMGCAEERSLPGSASEPVSELLAKWAAGDQEALQGFVPLVYRELRRIAHYQLQQERPDHTLQSTALVHEVYLRLACNPPLNLGNRAHFLAISALMTRRILVEYGRSRAAAKRDGGCKLTLDDASGLVKQRSVDLLALDDALNELARLDPEQSRIVELRFFGGLTIQQTAGVLGLSPATVKRYWATARAWLHHEMSRAPQP